MIIQRIKFHAYVKKKHNLRKSACLPLIPTMFKNMRDINNPKNIHTCFVFCLSSGFELKLDFELIYFLNNTMLKRSKIP